LATGGGILQSRPLRMVDGSGCRLAAGEEVEATEPPLGRDGVAGLHHCHEIQTVLPERDDVNRAIGWGIEAGPHD